jgi:uncharacterized membrane protein
MPVWRLCVIMNFMLSQYQKRIIYPLISLLVLLVFFWFINQSNKSSKSETDVKRLEDFMNGSRQRYDGVDYHRDARQLDLKPSH